MHAHLSRQTQTSLPPTPAWPTWPTRTARGLVATVAALGLVVGCTVPNPDYAVTDAAAPDLPGCPPCSGATPICDLSTLRCEGCLIDGDCRDPKAAICDRGAHRCVECLPDRADCPSGTICSSNLCAPGCNTKHDCVGGAGVDCCAHACVHTDGDAANCGACGASCGAGGACCGSRCFAVGSDVMNCGACGKACAAPFAVAACVGGSCAVGSCTMGHADCNHAAIDGCETSITADPANCGACGSACPAVDNAMPACDSGVCRAMCGPGFGDCDLVYLDGCEATLLSDPKNCGACGARCAPVANGLAGCAAGACNVASCSAGWADCNALEGDGCETHTDVDAKSCGKCGAACVVPHAIPACEGGRCKIGSCSGPFHDCDKDGANGCESNGLLDAKNCGACGNDCNGANCILGKCGLLAYYNFDEGQGQLLIDVTGNGNDGTHTAAYRAGKRGTAISFDGKSGGVVPAGKLEWGTANEDYTVEYWINIGAPATGAWRTVLHHGSNDTDRTSAQFLSPWDMTLYPVVSTVINWDDYFATPMIPVNLWTHFADVKTGNTHIVYINGAVTNAGNVANSVGNKGPLYLGRDPWYTGANCLLDELRIYRRALSASEVQADM